MDKRIRRNEICVVGMPRCDFVFSSTRTCFIAYGFKDSPIEKALLKRVIEEKGIQVEEAGGSLAPGQNAFCAKICSKIIMAQFCIVLLNNEEDNGREIPNANVNMEYGLMLGFNKYIIPFQKASQTLPFNVAGLDTIKYEDTNFEQKASDVVTQAIEATQQDYVQPISPDQVLEVFLLMKKALVTPLNTDGDRNIYQIGAPLGFNLLNDFAGMSYIYFGNFGALRSEVVVWRLRMLKEILDGRIASFSVRIETGVITEAQAKLFKELVARLQIWVVVTGNDEKNTVTQALTDSPLGYTVQVFSIEDVRSELDKLSNPSG